MGEISLEFHRKKIEMWCQMSAYSYGISEHFLKKKKKKKKKESEKYIQENKSWHFIQSILSVKIRKMF